MRSVGALLLLLFGLASPALAAEASDFTLRDVSGQEHTLFEHRGEVVLLVFFSACCGGCVEEMLAVQRLHEGLGPEGLTVLAISLDDARSASKVRPFVKRHRLTYPVLLDHSGSVTATYDPAKIRPFNVLLDRELRILETLPGYEAERFVRLEQRIRGLLDSKEIP